MERIIETYHTMKKLILSLLLVLASTMLMARGAQDKLGVSNLEFNGIQYHLGFSQNSSTVYLQEYFPKGQTYEKYDDMFTVSVITNVPPIVNPEMAVKVKEEELQGRKNKDVWNWAISNSPDKSEWMIDFMCYLSKNDSLEMIEFDVQKYRMIKVNGSPALQLVYYTHRVYGNDIMPFMHDKLADFRHKALNAIIPFEVNCKVKSGK